MYRNETYGIPYLSDILTLTQILTHTHIYIKSNSIFVETLADHHHHHHHRRRRSRCLR